MDFIGFYINTNDHFIVEFGKMLNV